MPLVAGKERGSMARGLATLSEAVVREVVSTRHHQF